VNIKVFGKTTKTNTLNFLFFFFFFFKKKKN
jgi:hypothetical protein